MNRSARSLLSVSVLVPLAAAFTVSAASANAAEGPSADLAYGAVAPVTAALPAGTVPPPVTGPVGKAAEASTGAVDEVLTAAQKAPELRRKTVARHANAEPDAAVRKTRCAVDVGKTVDGTTGSALPRTPLPRPGLPKTGLPKAGPGAGDCLGAKRLAERKAAPSPIEAGANTAGKVIGRTGKVTQKLQVGSLDRLGAAASTAYGNAGLPQPRGIAARSAAPVDGLEPGSPSRRLGKPVPRDGVLDKADKTVASTGKSIDEMAGALTSEHPEPVGPVTPDGKPIPASQLPPGMAPPRRVAAPAPGADLLGGLPDQVVPGISLPVGGPAAPGLPSLG
ncbi:hypothetical protein [Actinomadura rubrisoli]|uniref:ATP-binding protein n=1 Tax=Actinomadura rubrisoli TaxID=2530368 RepID=A0A4R5BZK9_9ACTN|nr:hypothetical protein [Actinomadura rubrisoli]TDD91356.1 hypothetical protein E1298_12065 [Actinomadura rubrisoli]